MRDGLAFILIPLDCDEVIGRSLIHLGKIKSLWAKNSNEKANLSQRAYIKGLKQKLA